MHLKHSAGQWRAAPIRLKVRLLQGRLHCGFTHRLLPGNHSAQGPGRPPPVSRATSGNPVGCPSASMLCNSPGARQDPPDSGERKRSRKSLKSAASGCDGLAVLRRGAQTCPPPTITGHRVPALPMLLLFPWSVMVEGQSLSRGFTEGLAKARREEVSSTSLPPPRTNNKEPIQGQVGLQGVCRPWWLTVQSLPTTRDAPR